MRRELSSERIDLGYVLLSFREFLLRFTFFKFIHFQPERVLEHRATLARIGEQYPIRLSLRNNVVARLADVGSREQLCNITEPNARAVD